MSFTYGQYGDDRYLVYQFGEEDVLETMSFGQITNNAIDGLAPATFSQMDTTRSMMYKITSRMPLENFLQNPIRKNDLLKIISGIVRALRSVQEYMIDPGMLLLDKKYMFLRVSNFDLHMICLPVENSPYGGTRLQDFLWQLVARTEKDKSESREYVAEMMERLDTDEPLSLDEIDEMVAEFSQKGAQREPAYKPAPVFYEKILSELRLQPEEALFVGDSIKDDVLGPPSVGMRACWVNRKHADPGGAQPDHIVADLNGLLSIPDMLF